MNYRNIGFIHSDDFNSATGTFDAVIVAAGADILPVNILNKLERGGKIVIPIHNGSGHTIRKIIKVSCNDHITEDIGKATFVPYITGETI
jgi:protein-L-isoaspartate O-methyltransferase